jgi:hypothetical protein
VHALTRPAPFTDGPPTLTRGRERIAAAGLLDLLQPGPDTVHDNTPAFGLTAPLAANHQAPSGLQEPAGLAVQVRAVWGRTLITADTGTGTGRGQVLVVDTRLLAGYRLGTAPERSHGLSTHTPAPPPGDDRDQHTLF